MVVENVLRADQTLPSYQCRTAVVLRSYRQSWTDKDRELRPRSDGLVTIMTDRGGLLWSGTSAKNDRHSVTWAEPVMRKAFAYHGVMRSLRINDLKLMYQYYCERLLFTIFIIPVHYILLWKFPLSLIWLKYVYNALCYFASGKRENDIMLTVNSVANGVSIYTHLWNIVRKYYIASGHFMHHFCWCFCLESECSFHSLVPGRGDCNLKLVIFKMTSRIVLYWAFPAKLPSGEYHKPHRWSLNIGSVNGLVPSGSKPKPVPMLTKFYDVIWCHYATIS